jgi:AcrR family transcriptional regulator
MSGARPQAAGPAPTTARGQLTGYARTGDGPRTALQARLLQLQDAGCARVFADETAGRGAAQPQLRQCLLALRDGDTLVVTGLDQLGRTQRELAVTVGELQRRGAELRALHEDLDTAAPGGDAVFRVFASLAELARASVSAGTSDGLAAARARGERLGRPPALTDQQLGEVRTLLAQPDATVTGVARHLGVSRSTLYKYLPDAMRTAAPAGGARLGPQEYRPGRRALVIDRPGDPRDPVPGRVELLRRASYAHNSLLVGQRGERTRRAVLGAAIDTFQARGLHATGIDDIAEAAGVSRATLYQYFENKEQIFSELADQAADELLAAIRRPADLSPTAGGYRSLRRWLSEWAVVQDKYQALSLQWTVIDFPEISLRPSLAQYIVSYVSSVTSWLGAAVGGGLDVDGAAMVLLPLLFRLNDYRERGAARGLADAELLSAVTTFVQFALFPSTPPAAIPPGPVGAVEWRGGAVPDGWSAGTRITSATAQRILDAGAAAFALRAYHATSVRDVLAAAGAGRSTFYRHFRGKADLLLELSRQCMGRLVEQAARFRVAISEPGALRPWIEESLALHRSYRGVIRALLQERTRHPALEELSVQSRAVIFSAFDGALGSVPRAYPFDVRVGSLILLALLERGADYQFGTRYDLGPQRVVDILTAFIERGLLAAAPEPPA